MICAQPSRQAVHIDPRPTDLVDYRPLRYFSYHVPCLTPMPMWLPDPLLDGSMPGFGSVANCLAMRRLLGGSAKMMVDALGVG